MSPSTAKPSTALVKSSRDSSQSLWVPLGALREDTANERKVFRAMEGLVESIKGNGIVEPPTVSPESGKDGFIIISGHRRFRAAKQAGLKAIEVIVRGPTNAIHRRRSSVIANLQREAIGPVEMARSLQELLAKDSECSSQEHLAAVIGMEPTWVSAVLGILRLPEDLLNKVGASQLSISYDALARIVRIPDKEVQRRLVEELLNGATTRGIREEANESKDSTRTKNSGGKKPKRVFKTVLATVVIQSKGERALSEKELVSTLKAALDQLSNA